MGMIEGCCAPISLCLTWQPEHSAKTVPLAHACGLTRFVVVSPHKLHVNFTWFRGHAWCGQEAALALHPLWAMQQYLDW